MKITIEGEPKEIAALELALKDGRQTEFTVAIDKKQLNGSHENPD